MVDGGSWVRKILIGCGALAILGALLLVVVIVVSALSGNLNVGFTSGNNKTVSVGGE
jgi:hypothetical protein